MNLEHMQEIAPDQFWLKSTQKTIKKDFKNLGRWCEVMLNERDPNDKTPFPSIEHDLTVEQRKERKEIVVSPKEEQRNQPEGSHCRIRVSGPPDAMRIVKIDTRTGKWDTLEKK